MKVLSSLWKASNWVMLTLFAMPIAIPLFIHPILTPDLAVYGAAGLVCVLAIRETNLTLLPPIVGIIALVWVLTLAPQVIGKVSFNEVFILGEMEKDLVHVARRMVGLWVVAFWMTIATIVLLLQRAANR